jgi:hypothetical protein
MVIVIVDCVDKSEYPCSSPKQCLLFFEDPLTKIDEPPVVPPLFSPECHNRPENLVQGARPPANSQNPLTKQLHIFMPSSLLRLLVNAVCAFQQNLSSCLVHLPATTFQWTCSRGAPSRAG